MSYQGWRVVSFQKIFSRMRRLSRDGRPRVEEGKSGWIRSHWESERKAAVGIEL